MLETLGEGVGRGGGAEEGAVLEAAAFIGVNGTLRGLRDRTTFTVDAAYDEAGGRSRGASFRGRSSACDKAGAEEDDEEEDDEEDDDDEEVERGNCVCTSSALDVFVTLLGLSDGTTFTLDAVFSVTAAPFLCMYLFHALIGNQGNCVESFSVK